MATKDDLLKTVIEQTESGKLKWRPTSEGWDVEVGKCRFEMSLTGSHWLYLYPDPELERVNIPQSEALYELLREKYPEAQYDEDKSVAIGLKCLLGEG